MNRARLLESASSRPCQLRARRVAHPHDLIELLYQSWSNRAPTERMWRAELRGVRAKPIGLLDELSKTVAPLLRTDRGPIFALYNYGAIVLTGPIR